MNVSLGNNTRKSAGAQASTLIIGLDVQKESSAVASGAEERAAEDVLLGTVGTWQGDLDQLMRKLQAKSKKRHLVYAAGPCGYWLYRNRDRVRWRAGVRFHPS